MLNEVFQKPNKAHTLQEIVKNSGKTKRQIAKELDMSVQWLNKRLKKNEESWTLGELRLLLLVLGYHINITISKE